MKRLYILFVLLFLLLVTWWISAMPGNYKTGANTNYDIINLSGKLLYAVKTDTPTDSIEKALAQLNPQDLLTGLNNDTARKTFWINIYNAWYQLLASRDQKSKPEIFTGRFIYIAGQSFSLDDIEHGILRKYRSKYSMGYLPQFLPDKRIKQLAVSVIDYRIHFALNCGARSCPPIAFYSYEKLEQQLNTAAVTFLKSETSIDTVNKKLTTSKILQWFKGDFGGKKGIRSLLSGTFQKDFSGYSILFNDYDWSARLNNFQND